MDWTSFFIGLLVGMSIVAWLSSIAYSAEETDKILRELACCEALKKCKENQEVDP